MPDAQRDAARAQDAALVRKAQKGDADAFAELVRAYQRRAMSVAYRLLGRVEDARDVSQDAFVRAYRSLGQLDDPARFGAWLLKTVCNLALNFRRSRARHAMSSLDDDRGDGSAIDPPDRGSRETGTGLEPMSAELRSAIDEAMKRLPDKQRLALVLFSVEGMPQREVAEVLECSVELVKWNVFQARQKLREALSDLM